jgi:hypothetical protein
VVIAAEDQRGGTKVTLDGNLKVILFTPIQSFAMRLIANFDFLTQQGETWHFYSKISRGGKITHLLTG